jgi:hypothetical protein
MGRRGRGWRNGSGVSCARGEGPESSDHLAEFTLHDLRRSFATHCAKALEIEPHVIEAAANHINGHKGGVAGIYNRDLWPAEGACYAGVGRDLLPVGPAVAMRVLVVHSGSGAAMVAGVRRSWPGLRSRTPADRRCAASGVRPPWAECGRTWL